MSAVDDDVAATAAPDPARPELPPSLVDRVRSIGLGLGVELRPARVLVAAVVLAVVAASGWWLLRSPSATAPDVDLPRAGVDGATPTSTSVETAPAETVVHAAGAVVAPGLYRLDPGARVADVIDLAGGPTADADLDQLNLAAKVADGERVYVPRHGESVPAPGGGAGPSGGSRLVDINTATVEELDALPGIGPAIAQAIVDHRTQHGRFRSVDDLLEVRGIGEAKLAELRERVTVG